MTTLNKDILVFLFELAQADTPASVQALASRLGVSRKVVANELNQLALAGLVNPEALRLTFIGLMQATGMRAKVCRDQAA